MFQIPDDIDFDDEFLDSNFNANSSKTNDDLSLLNVSKIRDQGSDCNPTHPNLSTNDNKKPNSLAATPGPGDLKPKLRKSPAAPPEEKQNIATSTAENFSGRSQQGSGDCNSVHARDKSYTQNSESLGNTQRTSHNHLLSGRISAPRNIPVALNTEIKSNLHDEAEPPFAASSHSSSHSAFLAAWNDNNFFNPTPNGGCSSKLRPISVTPNQSVTPEAVTRKVNKSIRQRRFPGPAGLLPPRQGTTSLIAPEEFLNELKSEESDPAYEETDLLSQSSGSIFEGGAWSAMLDDLGSPGQSLLKSMNLASIKATGRNLRSYKVPFLTVMVQSIDATLPDAAIGLKDPTGEMHGVVHREVWDQFSSDIAVGTVLVLRNVGIMSTGVSSRQHVVNITGRNLTAIYSPKDELNIQLRQIHEFATSNSSKLLDEWEKVESQSLSASPLSSRINKPALFASPYNSNIGSGIRPKHNNPYNSINSGQSHFTPSSSATNSRPQRFNSPMYNGNPGIPRFNSSSPKIPARPQCSANPFTPMPSRHSDGLSNRLQPPPPKNTYASPSSVSRQHPTPQKSPGFAVKAPSSGRSLLPGNRQHHNIPPAPDINDLRQQPSPRDHSSTSEPTVPKKPKVCQNSLPDPPKTTGKCNPFEVHDSSAVDSLLEGIDTDSLFGDF